MLAVTWKLRGARRGGFDKLLNDGVRIALKEKLIGSSDYSRRSASPAWRQNACQPEQAKKFAGKEIAGANAPRLAGGDGRIGNRR